MLKVITTLLNRHYSGHSMATEDENDQRTWKTYLEKEMWTKDFNYSWRKMQAAAQDTDGPRHLVHGIYSTGSNKT